MEKLQLQKITEQTNNNRVDNLLASPIEKIIEWTEGINVNIAPNNDNSKVVFEVLNSTDTPTSITSSDGTLIVEQSGFNADVKINPLIIPEDGKDGLDGNDGLDGKSISVKSSTSDANGNTILTLTDGTNDWVVFINRGLQGIQGNTGSNGLEGLSVYITTSELEIGGDWYSEVPISSIQVPSGRTLKVGDLLISLNNYGLGRIGQIQNNYANVDTAGPLKGADGKDGLDGLNGNDGTNGKDGIDGLSIYRYSLALNGGLGVTILVNNIDIDTSGRELRVGDFILSTNSILAKITTLYSTNCSVYITNIIKGLDGINGSNGLDGRGIKSSSITYQESTSGTTSPSGIWQTTIPSVAQGNYLWSRIILTYTDNTTSTFYSVSRQAIDGTNGSNSTDTPTDITSPLATLLFGGSGFSRTADIDFNKIIGGRNIDINNSVAGQITINSDDVIVATRYGTIDVSKSISGRSTTFTIDTNENKIKDIILPSIKPGNNVNIDSSVAGEITINAIDTDTLTTLTSIDNSVEITPNLDTNNQPIKNSFDLSVPQNSGGIANNSNFIFRDLYPLVINYLYTLQYSNNNYAGVLIPPGRIAIFEHRIIVGIPDIDINPNTNVRVKLINNWAEDYVNSPTIFRNVEYRRGYMMHNIDPLTSGNAFGFYQNNNSMLFTNKKLVCISYHEYIENNRNTGLSPYQERSLCAVSDVSGDSPEIITWSLSTANPAEANLIHADVVISIF